MALRNLLSKITGAPPQMSPYETELRRLSDAGDAARRNREPDQALEYYKQGLALAQNEGSLQGQEVFLGQIGALHAEQERFELAEPALTEALELANRTNEPVRRARALLNLGAYHLTRGNLAQAQRYLEQSLEFGRPTRDPIVIGLALANLADIYLKQDNPAYALRLLKEAVILMQAAQNTEQASYIMGRMGQAQLRVGDSERGRKF